MSVSCAVLLDRDGTLIEDKHYLSEPSGVALLPGVGPALSRLVHLFPVSFVGLISQCVGRAFSWCPTNPAWAGGISLNRLSWRAKNGLRNFWIRMA